MDVNTWLEQKKFSYNIFLRPLAFSNKFHVLFYKLKNKLPYFEMPSTLVLGSTYRCQLNCIHCGVKGYATTGKVELTTEELRDVIRQAHRLGVYLVNFAGGEPLMRNDIVELVEYTAKQGLIVSISTNGLLLSQAMAYQLKNKGVAFINVSIDSVYPEFHDQLRKSVGSFQKAKEAIISCVTAAIPVFISIYATKENIHSGDISMIAPLAKKWGAQGVKILLPIPAGRWLRCTNVILSEEEKRYVYNLLDPQYVYIEGVCNKFSECSAISRKLLYVSPYGEIQPCGFVPLSFGNVREEPLKNIWERMKTHVLYKTTDNTDCIMRNMNFRTEYIDSIEKDQELPITIKR